MGLIMNARITINEKDLIPTIIGIADLSYYLVGAVDSSNHFIGLKRVGEIDVFASLVQAKKYLRSNNISSAALEFQSAYDEMCGSSATDRSIQMIKL
ncbi:MAG: hypothetical protein ACJAS9_000926 [Polaribacter sp.]|jgi:hypothetical protein